MSGTNKRIGLFGGTFDPVHKGHLGIALEVKDRFHLEKVYFIPAAIPPHKPTRGLAGAGDRMEMIRLAVSDCPGLVVSDVELIRTGPSYTVDTVRHFKRIFPGDTELFFMVGTDAFYEIDTWKSYKSLFKLTPFVVMSRPETVSSDRKKTGRDIKESILAKISTGYRYDRDKKRYVHDENQPVYFSAVRPVPISSTQIRERIRNGRSIRDLVPKTVESYIYNRGLYQ